MEKTTIGVDKVVIYNLEIINADVDKLDYIDPKKNVRISRDNPIRTKSGTYMPEVSIPDNLRFHELKIYLTNMPIRKKDSYYTSISISVHQIFGRNLVNVTIDRLREYCEGLVPYIYDTYGILISFRSAQVKMIEINCTIPLEHPFMDYEGVLNIFQIEMPALYKFDNPQTYKAPTKNSDLKDPQSKLETIIRKNTRVEWIIYDKTEEMKKHDQYTVDDNLMRIELKLLNAKKIKEALGTTKLYELRNNDLVQYYNDQFEKVFVKPYYKWHERYKKFLSEMVTKFKKPSSHWQYALLEQLRNYEQIDGIPRLLDIDDLYEALPPDPNNHKARIMKGFYNKKTENDVYRRKDNNKAPEIFARVREAYEASKTTPDGGVDKN